MCVRACVCVVRHRVLRGYCSIHTTCAFKRNWTVPGARDFNATGSNFLLAIGSSNTFAQYGGCCVCP